MKKSLIIAIGLIIMGVSLTWGQNPTLDYSISKLFTTAGGTGIIRVTAGSGCSWTASSDASWITIASGASGTGPGNVQYTVAPNTGAQRTGTLTVQGHAYTITQSGTTQTHSATVAGSTR